MRSARPSWAMRTCLRGNCQISSVWWQMDEQLPHWKHLRTSSAPYFSSSDRSFWSTWSAIRVSETFQRIGAQPLERLSELVEQRRNARHLVAAQLGHEHALLLQGEAGQRLLEVLQALVSELRPLDVVALVVVAPLAADQRHAVDAARQRLADPDEVDLTETAHGDDQHPRVPRRGAGRRGIESRPRLVLAHEREDARLLLVLLRDLDRLDHAGDRVHRDVGEGDDALRASAEADAAPAAAERVVLRRTLGVLVDRAEGALLRSPPSLPAPL